jgi:hypothetical protein
MAERAVSDPTFASLLLQEQSRRLSRTPVRHWWSRTQLPTVVCKEGMMRKIAPDAFDGTTYPFDLIQSEP